MASVSASASSFCPAWVPALTSSKDVQWYGSVSRINPFLPSLLQKKKRRKKISSFNVSMESLFLIPLVFSFIEIGFFCTTEPGCICRWGWPPTQRDLSALAPRKLGSKVCATTSSEHSLKSIQLTFSTFYLCHPPILRNDKRLNLINTIFLMWKQLSQLFKAKKP